MNNQFLTTKEDITGWLEYHNIQNYSLIPDNKYGWVVNVEGDIDLSKKDLKDIPVKFNNVKGDINCGFNQLTSLEFCPESIGNFFCSNNKLTSLEGCPKIVEGDFYCSNNQLTRLEFCPQHVKYSFFCDKNKLTSLKYCPETIGDSFICRNNQLRNLEFCPRTVKGTFDCSNNQIETLEYCPEIVGKGFDCHDNSRLGDIQDIGDFKEIHQLHKKLLTINLYNKMKKEVKDKISHSNKIKI